MLGRRWRKRNTPALLVGWYNHSGNQSGGFLRKLDIILPENPAIRLLGIYPKDTTTYDKDIYSIIFTEALYIIARIWKEPDVL